MKYLLIIIITLVSCTWRQEQHKKPKLDTLPHNFIIKDNIVDTPVSIIIGLDSTNKK